MDTSHYTGFMLKYGPRCRLCFRRGEPDIRGACETCRIVKGELFKLRKKHSAAVLRQTAELIGVTLGQAEFTWSSVRGLADGAFRGTPDNWGTRALANRGTGYEVRKYIRKAAITAIVLVRHTEEGAAML